ncbi:putative purine permease YbbY [Ornithinibacillus halotolerans]|uniref:Purine permease YbbY n=2 Tax=Ornithinibacillus halotolerans TaxID=1274357 RepID=A0A916W512_9BACI|nr:putative purine permease YbbY [Ornithinibacillus halotolerans]
MMNEIKKADNWLGGLQWLMFIFINTVVVPITVGAAYDLSQEHIVSMMQFSFIIGGIGCLLQAIIGHRRPIMDGPSGLWWGVILALSSMSAAQGIPLAEVGGSIAVGVIIAGVLTILIGITGFGYYLEKLFNPSVMGTFMLLFGVSLCISFFKYMFISPTEGTIDIGMGLISLFIAILVIVLSVKGSKKIAQYSMLIGIVVGWPLFAVILGSESQLGGGVPSTIELFLFPLGEPAWNIGIIITVVVTGILNLSKQYGSIKGTDIMYPDQPSTSKDYRNSFTITGVQSILSGFLGLVPYSPFVSSIGFIQQTKIYDRMPFLFASVMFFIMGIIPQIGYFFTLLPLSIGSAVLFVSYVTLFGSGLEWYEKVTFNSTNVYRAAIPLFIGLVLFAIPGSAWATLPEFAQPLLSSGLLMGTIIAIVVESLTDWDKVGIEKEVTQGKNV